MASDLNPPKAKKIPTELTSHGHTRIDPYYWLNERNNPEVRAYLEAENAYTEAKLAHTRPLQEKLFQEMVGRIKQDDTSVPFLKNGYLYFHRFREGDEYPTYFRQANVPEAEPEILLPVQEMARNFDYYSAVGLTVSDDNRLLLFGEDTKGRRLYTLRLKDLERNAFLPIEIPNTSGNAVWAADSRHFFYVLRDETLRPYKVMRHKVGTDPSQDEIVYEEQDKTFALHLKKSLSGKFVFIVATSTTSTEIRFLPASKPNGQFQIVEMRQRDHEYFIDHHEDEFIILTNRNAQNFQIMKTPISAPSAENWQVLIPHSESVLLEEMRIFSRYMAILERQNGLTKIRIYDFSSKEEHHISFDEDVYFCFFGKNAEYDTETLRFCYTSLTTPLSTFDYHMKTRQRALLKQEPVLGGFKQEEYQTARLFTTAKDGAKIPISVVWKKSLKQPNGNPLLLYGYGAYGISMDPVFRAERLSLLDRGFVFAIAHVRGGQEFGRSWYEQGRLFQKMNTFTDFIACAEQLIQEGWTTASQLCIMGGSAGGLLIGAVVNMRPELFKAAVAAVPFVDVVTTMLDESIPLTTGEFDEWGNPKQKDAYDYILRYSPYDNIKSQDYPAMMVTAGFHDSQVQYWEPAKWVARLRDFKTDDRPVFLFTNMEAGHSGKSGRFRRLKETALIYAFLLDQFGISR